MIKNKIMVVILLKNIIKNKVKDIKIYNNNKINIKLNNN